MNASGFSHRLDPEISLQSWGQDALASSENHGSLVVWDTNRRQLPESRLFHRFECFRKAHASECYVRTSSTDVGSHNRIMLAVREAAVSHTGPYLIWFWCILHDWSRRIWYSRSSPNACLVNGREVYGLLLQWERFRYSHKFVQCKPGVLNFHSFLVVLMVLWVVCFQFSGTA